MLELLLDLLGYWLLDRLDGKPRALRVAAAVTAIVCFIVVPIAVVAFVLPDVTAAALPRGHGSARTTSTSEAGDS